jgi:Rrf2 family protein
MEITHQADYALRAILYLAGLTPGVRVPTSQIARENRIPPSFLTKIVSQLSIAGIIHTSRGAHGGVWLARSSEEISLLDVLTAIDGNVVLNHCVDDPATCTFVGNCPIHTFWQEACHSLVSRLRTTTFSQLSKRQPVAIAA